MTSITNRYLRNQRARLAVAIEPLEKRVLLTTVIVNTTADSTDAPGSAAVSLRDAVNIANTSTTATTIIFSPTVFALATTITLSGTELELTGAEPVSIVGPAAGVTIDGNQMSRDFLIDQGATVSLSRMTITGGSGGGNNNDHGGGMENEGALTMFNVTLSGNSASQTFGSGGGIDNTGTATLMDCIVSGNTTDFYGTGGGINNNGLMTVIDSTISGNASGASDQGGGIESGGSVENGRSGGTLILTGCTISGNTGGSNGGGGGLFLGSGATLTNCTISNNTDPSDSGGGIQLALPPGAVVKIFDCTISGNSSAGAGGGIDNFVFPNPNGGANYIGGECDIANTIIAGNMATVGPDTTGTFNSSGFNLIGNVGASTGWKGADFTGTSVKPLKADLGPLAKNGGPTRTILPLAGSPAIDHGSNSLIPTGFTTDQRGIARIVNGTVDIGAVEVHDRSLITGSVFLDANGSFNRDASETGLAGFTVYLDLNNNGSLDVGEPSTLSKPTGYYAVTGLAPGKYVVRIVARSGYLQTAPTTAPQKIVGTEQTVIGPNFGEVPNLLINGDFSQGVTGFSSQYVNTGTPAGGYLVASDPTKVFDKSWVAIGDHTTGTGLMLLADAATTANTYVWQETVNVATGTNYSFAGWAADMHKLDNEVPDLAVFVNNVQIGKGFAVPSNPGGIWSSFGAAWNSGSSKTATIKIVDLNTDFVGNDFALDDLSFAV